MDDVKTASPRIVASVVVQIDDTGTVHIHGDVISANLPLALFMLSLAQHKILAAAANVRDDARLITPPAGMVV
jgi:hypothetical protein